MRRPKLFKRLCNESGPAVAVVVAATMLVGLVAPASAQFFPFGFFQQQPPPRPRQSMPQQPRQQYRTPFSDFFSPYQSEPQVERQQPAQRVDYSRAPPPRPDKNDAQVERSVLVLGDAMADWLAYGLEDALAEQPDIGVIRKHKTISGLIKYQPRGEPSDWIGAAKGIIAAEKADAIVVMLGLHDRTSIVETAADRAAIRKDDKKNPKPNGSGVAETEADDQTNNEEPPPIMAPERGAHAAGTQEFRSDRWAELYKKKIEDMIAVLKTKNVPILWVGLPAIRGQKSTADALFLNALYRDVAAKTGVTYVDVWDGFVDESGRFLVQGPDFEGQTRRLRTSDGVYFTRAGARKLAHYVDRELQRLILNRATPVALPADPSQAEPDAAAPPPDGAPPRPMAGPVLPLTAASVNSTELMGGPTSRMPAADSLAARALVKGEALSAPGGRADDTSWPRRAIASLNAVNDPLPTAANPNATPEAISAAAANVLSAPMPAAPAKRRPAPTAPAAHPQQAQQRAARPRPPAPMGWSVFGRDSFFRW